jgi:hypothetical protein
MIFITYDCLRRQENFVWSLLYLLFLSCVSLTLVKAGFKTSVIYISQYACLSSAASRHEQLVQMSSQNLTKNTAEIYRDTIFVGIYATFSLASSKARQLTRPYNRKYPLQIQPSNQHSELLKTAVNVTQDFHLAII